MTMAHKPDKQVPNAVKLEKMDGHWTVFLVEDGEITQQTFETKQFAKNFAAGQRLRLGVSPRKT
jgi:hypothetical protein